MKLTYNSTREELIIPEYGRNVQQMVKHAVSISDREERNKCARAIINIMGQLFPHLRDVDDFRHKLWDHLFVMSEFKLDVDAPYPVPTAETFQAKPRRVRYPQSDIKYGHYGKTVEDLIAKAIETTDEAERKEFTLAIANLMKRNFVMWSQGSVKDEVILADLKNLSKGKLQVADPAELVDTNKLIQQANATSTNSNSGPKKGKKSGSRNKSRKKRN